MGIATTAIPDIAKSSFRRQSKVAGDVRRHDFLDALLRSADLFDSKQTGAQSATSNSR